MTVTVTALGSGALALATVAACLSAAASWNGQRRVRPAAVAWGRRGLVAVFVLVSVGMVALGWALVGQDYSLVYVADNASRDTTWPYRLAGLWGGMSGSLLLWTWMLAGWALVASRTLRRRLPALAGGAQAVLAVEAAVFLGLLVAVSRPFATLAVPAIDGGGLTPILRHPAMLYHPPLLYLGYVGLAVPAAVAIAALATGLGGDWLAVARRFLLPSLVLLAVGMAAGAHWAYAELGWGGYWAWDPVENGALLPWLAGIAFVHSALIAERRTPEAVPSIAAVARASGSNALPSRAASGAPTASASGSGGSADGARPGLLGALDLGASSGVVNPGGSAGGVSTADASSSRRLVGASTHGLAFLAFGLSLLGAFLTRSGVTGSVHAFAEARAVGRVLLVALAAAAAAMAGLMVKRRHRGERPGVEALTQAGAVRANNALLLAVIVVVGFGLLYPVLSGDDLVVTGRYFAIVTSPLALGLLAAIGVGPRLGWRSRPWPEVRARLRPAWWGIAALVVAAVGLDDRRPLPMVMIGLAGSAGALTLAEWRSRTRPRNDNAATADRLGTKPGHSRVLAHSIGSEGSAAISIGEPHSRQGLSEGGKAVVAGPRCSPAGQGQVAAHGTGPRATAAAGGLVAHLGVAVLLAGVAGTATGAHRTASLVPGQSVTVRDYSLRLDEVVPVAAPDGGRAAEAVLSVRKGDRRVAILRPVALVAASGDRVSEAALRSTPVEDLQVALRSVSSGGGAVVVEIFVVPLAQWVWWGAILMAVGIALSIGRPPRPQPTARPSPDLAAVALPS